MSRQYAPLQSLTVSPEAAVAAHRFVSFADAQAATQGMKVKGVTRAAIAAGDDGDIIVSGTALVELGADVTKGASLITDNAGKAMPATSALKIAAGATAVTSAAANGITTLAGADLPEYVAADALEAGSAGDIIEVLLRR